MTSHDRFVARIGASAMRLAALKTLESLETSSGWARVRLQEGEIHPGDPPLGADYEAHHRFANVLNSHLAMSQLSVVDILGEERLPSTPVELRPGERIVVVDPLDGSTQWALIRAGHCVAAMMLVASADGQLTMESAIVANPVHTFSLVRGDRLKMGSTNGSSDDDIVLTSCLPETLNSPSVAVTGYKTKDRGSMLAFLRNIPRWAFLTIGGNPVTPYVIAGDLTASLTWRAQYTWDAVAILMATQTDAVVGDIEGTLVNKMDFGALFNRLVLTQSSPAIPPMIVAKSKSRFDELVVAVQRSRSEFGEPFGTGVEELGYTRPCSETDDEELPPPVVQQ